MHKCTLIFKNNRISICFSFFGNQLVTVSSVAMIRESSRSGKCRGVSFNLHWTKMTLLMACVVTTSRQVLVVNGFKSTIASSLRSSSSFSTSVNAAFIKTKHSKSLFRILSSVLPRPYTATGAVTAGRMTSMSSTTTSDIDATTCSSSTTTVEHPAYDIIQRDVVTEYGYDCTLYRHKKSGAELLSVVTDDDNKVFGITFRTPPSDSTGVPHILEHSVLCGSRKYTTKDPFVQLLQGSLQTFLNAFTYPDRTCYVVASQNTKDFYNLINVYTDAVFHPRAIEDPNVHAQEGWHLELENPSEPLKYKGVVYNEMKGIHIQRKY